MVAKAGSTCEEKTFRMASAALELVALARSKAKKVLSSSQIVKK